EQLAVAFEQRHRLALQVIGVDSVQTLDVGVATLLECAPIELGVVELEAVARVIRTGFGQRCGVEHDLLRHTTDVHTRASKLAALYYGHRSAVACRAPRRGQATAATTQHHQVELFHSVCLAFE